MLCQPLFTAGLIVAEENSCDEGCVLASYAFVYVLGSIPDWCLCTGNCSLDLVVELWELEC
jgi:hypothetical protein